MAARDRSQRTRRLRPVLDALEGRALLSAAPLHSAASLHASAQVVHAAGHNITASQAQSSTITIINRVTSNGVQFTNFDGPNAGTTTGTGTIMNGITNSGHAVGFTTTDSVAFLNFVTDPLKWTKAGLLNINGSTAALAFAANSAGTVVGSDGNAFFLRGGKVTTFIPTGGTSAVAFGVNDHNTIVGQYVAEDTTPGFIRVNGKTTITINAPSGADTVFAQGINNKGLVVGFYVGTDGQDHGFIANEHDAQNGTLTGTAVADPVIPTNPAEPGATFVFSQILGINDHGIAVGYYGDSTGSQHGFIYDTRTGQYFFLDDPSAAFDNGVVITQITGITNSDKITGFYTDANEVAHGFVARPTSI